MATATQQRDTRAMRVEAAGEWPRPVTDDLAYLQTGIVNVLFYGKPGAHDWVLIDAGMYGYAGKILKAAEARYGPGARPVAIVLTHGHFDHVGALRELSSGWDVPIYAHALERPYLDGRSPYAPPDPSVGGGLMADLSWMYPRGPIDVSDRLRTLPADGNVPGMPGWQWVHTPGHTPGHVSFFRDSDRTLIAGDAFVTTRQESLIAVMRQRKEIHGPPAYFTSDWASARRSVERLRGLHPKVAITGHGVPMAGPELEAALGHLADDFDAIAVPHHGRYAVRPAVADETGLVSVPPDTVSPWPRLALGLGAGLTLGFALTTLAGRKHR